MQNKYKSLIVYALLTGIVIAGFIFRLQGIIDNHSFWSDEAYVATLGRDIVTSKRSIPEAIKLLNYQPLHVLTTALSMKLFGFNEFSARLPVVLFGTLGIIAAFLLAKKLSNAYGGLLAAFLYAISQLNLANSTQAKPNTAIQTIFIFNIYLLSLLYENKKNVYLHTIIIALSCIATLFHFIGILVFIPYFIFIITNINYKNIFVDSKKIIYFLLFSVFFMLVFFLSSGKSRFENLFNPTNIKDSVFLHNISLLRELLWKNYSFITLPALFGLILSYKRKRVLTATIITYVVILIFFWVFYAFGNIRYVLPIIALMFMYFAVFWSYIGEKILMNKSWAVCLLVAIAIYLGGNKIVRIPQNYYSPNEDLYGDVQFADYKNTYKYIGYKYPNLSKVAIFNDWHEAQYWYLPNKLPNAYFIKNEKNNSEHWIDKQPVYNTLSHFLNAMSKYDSGILIVEDWDSLLPNDIKNYAKSNLKLEFRSSAISQAVNDPWPVEIYSWHSEK
ncbi:MAG: glycosyltransferase family 39 protein [Candidatus Roizmanbacteria bacterium]|nr:glycosyltransferase family 39 protein [Candidatus Roizmanbacteria bacterium]